MRSKIGKNSGSSSGRPLTLVKIWMPFAPSWPIARSISSSDDATLFIGSEATKAGKRSRCCATISAMASFASLASSGVSFSLPRNSTAGMESVRICLYSGKRFIILMRFSRSQSTGMCIQRLSCAASAGLRSAICFMRSKYALGKMCGKISSLSIYSSCLLGLFVLDACHGCELAPALGFSADHARERLAEERLGDFLPDVDHALLEFRVCRDRWQVARQAIGHLPRCRCRNENAKKRAQHEVLDARLRHRRYLGHERRARAAGHRERPHLAGLDAPDRSGDAGDQHLDLARYDIGDAGAAAVVGHVRHVELAAMREKLADKMGIRADAGRAIPQVVLLGVFHQLGNALHWNRRMYDKDVRRARHHRHRHQIAFRVVGKALAHAFGHAVRLRRAEKQRVAVRGRARRDLRTARAAAARAVLP